MTEIPLRILIQLQSYLTTPRLRYYVSVYKKVCLISLCDLCCAVKNVTILVDGTLRDGSIELYFPSLIVKCCDIWHRVVTCNTR